MATVTINVDTAAGRAALDDFVDGFGEGMAEAEAQGRTFDETIQTISHTLNVVNEVFSKVKAGIEAVVGALASVTAEVARADEEMLRLSQRIGSTVESTSHFAFAAKSVGIEVGELKEIINPLTMKLAQIAEGNETVAASFEKVGIETKRADGSMLSSTEVLTNMATAFASIEDPGEKARSAVLLMGESGSKVVPVLEQIGTNMGAVAERAKALGFAVTEAEAAISVRFNQSLRESGILMEALQKNTGQQLMPLLSTLIENVNKVGEAMLVGIDWKQVNQLARDLFGIFANLAEMTAPLASGLITIGNVGQKAFFGIALLIKDAVKGLQSMQLASDKVRAAYVNKFGTPEEQVAARDQVILMEEMVKQTEKEIIALERTTDSFSKMAEGSKKALADMIKAIARTRDGLAKPGGGTSGGGGAIPDVGADAGGAGGDDSVAGAAHQVAGAFHQVKAAGIETFASAIPRATDASINKLGVLAAVARQVELDALHAASVASSVSSGGGGGSAFPDSTGFGGGGATSVGTMGIGAEDMAGISGGGSFGANLFDPTTATQLRQEAAYRSSTVGQFAAAKFAASQTGAATSAVSSAQQAVGQRATTILSKEIPRALAVTQSATMATVAANERLAQSYEKVAQAAGGVRAPTPKKAAPAARTPAPRQSVTYSGSRDYEARRTATAYKNRMFQNIATRRNQMNAGTLSRYG